MNVTTTGNVTLNPAAAAPAPSDLPVGLIAGVGGGSVVVLGSIIAASTADTRAVRIKALVVCLCGISVLVPCALGVGGVLDITTAGLVAGVGVGLVLGLVLVVTIAC